MDRDTNPSATVDVQSARMGVTLGEGRVVAGRYRLERALGRGGMGAVWEATHTLTRRRVALKFVRGPAHARAELRRRFLREARAVSAVRHPNVVEIVDVFELDEETPVMVMELLIGETLRERIDRREQLSLAETAQLMLPVVSAVGAAHARGIVHRDLKPDNIFVTAPDGPEPRVKVLDFGIAKLAAAIEGGGLLTQTGATLGTPCYMAPEQAIGDEEIDHRVDVWALGVILYECLSGVRPIEGESVGQVVYRLMSAGITPLERLVPSLPHEITDLIAMMLARERKRRPEDLRSVAEVLSAHARVQVPSFGPPGTEIGDEEPQLPTHLDVPTPSPVRRPRSRRRLAALATAVAIAASACAWALAKGPAVADSAANAPEPPARAAVVAMPGPEAPVRTPVATSPSAASGREAPVAAPRRRPERKLAHAPPEPSAAVASSSSAEPVAPLRGLADTPPF